MSFAYPPSYASEVFNPANYPTGGGFSSGSQKVDSLNGYSKNQVIEDAAFRGTMQKVTGIPITNAEFECLAGTKRKIQDQIDTNDTTVKNSIENLKTAVFSNPKTQELQNFPSDVLAYYDFSDPSRVGRDFSGRGRHLESKFGGVSAVSDTTRVYAAEFLDYAQGTGSNFTTSSCPAILRNPAMASSLRTGNLTCSFWVKPSAHTGAEFATIWGMSDPSQGTFTGNNLYSETPASHCSLILTSGGNVQLYQNRSGNFFSHIVIPVGQWTHVCVTITPGANGVVWYRNGVLVPGTRPDQILLAAHTYDNFTVGGLQMANFANFPSATAPLQYKFRLTNERLSDLMFIGRVLTASEVLSLYQDDYGYDVFPIAGQSNAVGYCEIEPGKDDDYSGLYRNGASMAFSINSGGVIAPAVNPLPFPESIPFVFGGLWLQFARDYIANTYMAKRRKILFVPVAVGGTRMSLWVPGGARYNYCVSNVNAAIAANKLNKLQALLWNQGESDITNLNTNYKADLLAMIAGYQTDISQFTSTLPKVMALISSGSADRFVTTVSGNQVQMKKVVNDGMKEIAAADPTWRVIDTSDLTLRPEAVPYHYDQPSYRTIGHRYFDAVIEMKGGPSLRVLPDLSTAIDSNTAAIASNTTAISAVATDLNGTKGLVTSAQVVSSSLADFPSPLPSDLLVNAFPGSASWRLPILPYSGNRYTGFKFRVSVNAGGPFNTALTVLRPDTGAGTFLFDATGLQITSTVIRVGESVQFVTANGSFYIVSKTLVGSLRPDVNATIFGAGATSVSYNLSDLPRCILINTTSQSMTVSLPTPQTADNGMQFRVKGFATGSVVPGTTVTLQSTSGTNIIKAYTNNGPATSSAALPSICDVTVVAHGGLYYLSS